MTSPAVLPHIGLKNWASRLRGRLVILGRECRAIPSHSMKDRQPAIWVMCRPPSR